MIPDEIVRRRFRQALPSPPLDPSLLGRITAQLPDRSEGMPFPRLAVALTGILAITVVAGFLYADHGLRPSPKAAVNTPACLLPVLSSSGPGYLDPSTGSFRPDRQASGSSLPGPATRPGAPNPYSYDFIAKRWLPVDRRSVTPDGSGYAYVSQDGSGDWQAYSVRVDTGFATPVWNSQGQPGSYEVIDDEVNSLYLDRLYDGKDTLLQIDLASPTRAPRVVDTSPGRWLTVAQGSAWAIEPDPNRLVRFDLAHQTRTTWYSAGGAAVSLVGLRNNGDPILRVADHNRVHLLLLIGANQPDTLYDEPGTSAFSAASAVGDGSRVWISDQDSLWLYTPEGGLARTALASVGGLTVVGTCQAT